MMLYASPLLLVSLWTTLVLLTSEIASADSTAAVTICPRADSIERGSHYHGDNTCNRVAYNEFKASLNRHLKHQTFQKMGGISHVPNQKTITCPANGARVDMMTLDKMMLKKNGVGSSSGNVTSAHTFDNTNTNIRTEGVDSVFIVENRASTPIVLSYINRDGIEVSARNPKIVPAIRDPQSIMKPDTWMAVYATEGHEFIARAVHKNGMVGNVLLQHRVGLIPIGQHLALSSMDCPMTDIEPMIAEQNSNETHRAPEYARTPPATLRPCHTLDVGFRNLASCPLHAYYVKGDYTVDENKNTTDNQCIEKFKFHLGVQHNNLDDFLWDWTSATKYEGTFIGHTFHFRLAHDPRVLVDTVTLQPITVTDCPETKIAETTTMAVATNVGQDITVQQQQYSVDIAIKNISSFSPNLDNLVLLNTTKLTTLVVPSRVWWTTNEGWSSM